MPTVTILKPEPGRQTTAAGINDDGLVVGSEDGIPFVWRPASANATVGSIVELGRLPEHSVGKGAATAINRQGDVVGFCETFDSTGGVVARAVLWRTGTTDPVPLGTLLPDGGPGKFRGNSRAFAINDSGQIVGVSDAPSGARAAIFDPAIGELFELPPPPFDLAAGPGEALAINNFGMIVGSHRLHKGGRMVRLAYRWHWQPPPDTPFGQPLIGMGESDAARAINSSGIVVGDAQPGSSSDSVPTSVAVRFEFSGMATPVVESRFSTARAVSDDGVIVGAHGQNAQDVQRAFRLVADQFEDIGELSEGLRIVRAVGVNRQGQIAAVANNGSHDLAVLITF